MRKAKEIKPSNGFYFTAVVVGGTEKRLETTFKAWHANYRIKVIKHYDPDKSLGTIQKADLLVILGGKLGHAKEQGAIRQAKSAGMYVIRTTFRRSSWYQVFRRRGIVWSKSSVNVLETCRIAAKQKEEKEKKPSLVSPEPEEPEEPEECIEEVEQLSTDVERIIRSLTGVLFASIKNTNIESILITDTEINIEHR